MRMTRASVGNILIGAENQLGTVEGNQGFQSVSKKNSGTWVPCTLRQSNIAMENPPFEDVFPIQDGDFPLLCLFTGGYIFNSKFNF